MQRIPTKRRNVNTGARLNIPGWLSNPEMAAPCICGMPLMPGQPHVMAEGETGMKRWFHMSCWNVMENDDEEDWDDWDDEEDDD